MNTPDRPLPGAVALLDVQSITPSRPPGHAIHRFTEPAKPPVIETDVLIAGGGTGGVAAALALSRLGKRVCLVEETDWLGGQFSSQGVSALDEHELIESYGGTAGYYEFRERVRGYYRNRHAWAVRRLRKPHLNPGDAWVSRLCFEPEVGHHVALRMLEDSPLPPKVFLRCKPYRARVHDRQVRALRCYRFPSQEVLEFRARCFLDATELGELLELCGDAWVVGAESREVTGEPDALTGPSLPALQQSFSYPFCVCWKPETGTIVKEFPGYGPNRSVQPYTLLHHYADGRGWIRYWMFRKGRGAMGPFWTYRRLLSGELFGSGSPQGDLSMINWPGNDYRGVLCGVSPDEQAHTMLRAQRLSLGFLRWLQTECPRDDGGTGYPEIQLAASAMGTRHGLSKYPYIRESRRLLARQRILQQDIARRFQQGVRARRFEDSVGIGWYAIDIHAGGPDESAASEPAAPFQIPLGALVSTRLDNLIPACKNIGVTHITNGAYRLQPVEWNIGEAAGTLAAFCQNHATTPDQVRRRKKLRHALQSQLLAGGVPLFWLIDIPQADPLFAEIQTLAVRGLWPINDNDLRFRPDEPATGSELKALGTIGSSPTRTSRTRRQLAEQLYRAHAAPRR